MASAASIRGSYVSKVEITNTGVINAYYGGSKANAKIPLTSYLSFSPITNVGSIEWRCKNGAGLQTKYLPSSCR